MSDYGTVIDSNLLPEKTAIYELFVAYFNNPILTKTKNEDGGSMYVAKMNLLMRDYRYLIVIEYEMDCNNFSYMSSGKAPFDSRLFLKEKNENMAKYYSKDHPKLSMCLLAKKKNDFTSYPELGTIAGALETFRTIFQITI